MTPSQLEDYARQQYNAVSDNFFSESEILAHVFNAQMRLAIEAKCIKKVFTATSVNGQQEYTAPSTLLGIFRASYDNERVQVVQLDELLRMTEGITISSGFTDYIAHWGDRFYLGPIPSEDGKIIKIWAFCEPQKVTANSLLEVPTRHQFKIVNYLLGMMALKDNNNQLAQFYLNLWEKDVIKANREERMFERTGGLTTVRNEDYSNGVE